MSETCSISGRSAAYLNDTSSNSTRPRTSAGLTGSAASGACSGASSSANTRSADATLDCSRFAMLATWVSGWLNCREYWMKAVTAPRVSEPLAISRPPTTATST